MQPELCTVTSKDSERLDSSQRSHNPLAGVVLTQTDQHTALTLNYIHTAAKVYKALRRQAIVSILAEVRSDTQIIASVGKPFLCVAANRSCGQLFSKDTNIDNNFEHEVLTGTLCISIFLQSNQDGLNHYHFTAEAHRHWYWQESFVAWSRFRDQAHS